MLAERMLLAESVSRDCEAAVAPLRIAGELVHEFGDWLLTATPFLSGRPADASYAADARLMGRTLAELHHVLARLDEANVPPVAALDGDHHGDRAGWQLLHGDFSDQNVIATSSGLRIFDFDDSGYGPILYDVANSLYMVRFDADVNGRRNRYEVFRPSFLDGYAEAIGDDVDLAVVDSLIDLRVDALARWLDDPVTAPIGIRTSSQDWKLTLRSFVSAYRAFGPDGPR